MFGGLTLFWFYAFSFLSALNAFPASPEGASGLLLLNSANNSSFSGCSFVSAWLSGLRRIFLVSSFWASFCASDRLRNKLADALSNNYLNFNTYFDLKFEWSNLEVRALNICVFWTKKP